MGFPIGKDEREPRDSCDDLAFALPLRLGTGRWSRWIAVAGGCGYVPRAPGTAGSAAGALLFLVVVALFRGPGSTLSPGTFFVFYGLFVGALLLVGIAAAGRAEVDFGRRDDGRIVIDEVVGQLIALAPLALLFHPEVLPAHPEVQPAVGRTGILELSIAVVTGFVLFRLFDVWKPGAIGWAERRFKGGFGVMADDVVAGVYGAVCLTALDLLVFDSSRSGFSIDLGMNLGNPNALTWVGFGVAV